MRDVTEIELTGAQRRLTSPLSSEARDRIFQKSGVTRSFEIDLFSGLSLVTEVLFATGDNLETAALPIHQRAPA